MLNQDDGKYNLNAFQKTEEAERLLHEEEMKKATERLFKAKNRRKKSFISLCVGVFVGILYIVWIALSPSLVLPSGISLYEKYISLGGGSTLSQLLLDFLPPVLLSVIFSLIAARGDKGKIYFVLTALMSLFVVLAVFLLYISMMAM